MSKGNRKRRQELGLLPQPGRCAARSSRTREPCKNAPINGSAVCRWHGGAAPQVLAKARERLALAADDAVSTLIRLMTDERISPSDRRQAATAILDRAGIGTKAELDVTVAPWIGALEGMVAENVGGVVMTRTHDYSSRREPLGVLPPQAHGVDEVVDAEIVEDEPVAERSDSPWVDGTKAPRPRASQARIVRD